MPWNPQGGGGGPWGSGGGGGGRGQSPWGRPNGGGGGGGGSQPPDIEEMLRKGQDKLKRMMPGGKMGGGAGILAILALIILGWALSGFFRVQAQEQGVVLRFGEYVYTVGPGLHYHLPYPVEQVYTPNVTNINRIEVGFRSLGDGSRNAPQRDVLEESLMLTGDENIVDIDFSVFWRINDAGDFLFKLRDPAGTVRVAAESVMREIIGQTPIQLVLTEGRAEIEQKTQDTLQALLDNYGAGVAVTQVQILKSDPPSAVIDAFNDVQRAKADRERLRNEAEAYRNGVIPRARGEASALVQGAEAYKEQVINQAEGDASRFTAVLQAYKQAPSVTARRLYLESLEEVLGRAQKVILDAGEGGSGVVPYLPLPEIQKRQQAGDTQTGNSQQEGNR